MFSTRRTALTALLVTTMIGGASLSPHTSSAGTGGGPNIEEATLTIDGPNGPFAYRPGVTFSYQIDRDSNNGMGGPYTTFLIAFSGPGCTGSSGEIDEAVSDTVPVTETATGFSPYRSFNAVIFASNPFSIATTNCIEANSQDRPPRSPRPGAVVTPVAESPSPMVRSPRPGASAAPPATAPTPRADRPARPTRPA